MIGDFNLRLRGVAKCFGPVGFKGALSSDIATRSLGNQIDQVFRNCEEVPFPTDHLVISATILIKSSKDSQQ